MLRTFALGVVPLALTLAACGSSDEEKRGAPPPTLSGTDDETFSLEPGTYYVTEIRELNDGCQKRPLDAQDSLTQVAFNLTNDGSGTIGLDFCHYDDKGVSGLIRGNSGVLSVIHHGRKMGQFAQFDQDCRIDLKMTADNTFNATYTEVQRNRNQAMRDATVNASSCTTSFDFTMQKRS